MFTIELKRFGKKKLKKYEFDLGSRPDTLKYLLIECVRVEANQFNKKIENSLLIPFLSSDEMREQASHGKIGIGDHANNMLAIESEAINNVLQSFEDGLFVVFIGDDKVTQLEQKITIDSDSPISFIRMTFLTGTFW